jgi:hypothetical protein
LRLASGKMVRQRLPINKTVAAVGSLARIYRYLCGPTAGRRFEFVLVSPDGTPFGGTGTAATGEEGWEACEALILLETRAMCSNVSALCDNPPLGLCQ